MRYKGLLIVLVLLAVALLKAGADNIGGTGAVFFDSVTSSGNVFSAGEWHHPLVTSCDAGGNEIDQFAPGESVYAKATGLEGNTEYQIWIQDYPVAEGDPLVIGENPSTETPTLVTTAPDGSVGPTPIWQIPSNAPVTYHEYDIVFDKQGDGDNTGKYNAASDGICSFSVVGSVAPVPELATILLFGLGLACLGGYLGLRRARCQKGRIS